jgi:hypothetical protein
MEKSMVRGLVKWNGGEEMWRYGVHRTVKIGKEEIIVEVV